MSVKNVKDAIEVAVNHKASKSGKNGQEYYNELKEQVANDDSRAVSSLQDLVNLIVITYNEATLLKPGMNEFISQFIDEPRDDNGNGRRYIKHFIQKAKDYQENKFIPTGTTNTYFKTHFIKFKEQNGSLSSGSVRKLFEIVYIEADLITYFINGQLDVFIQEQILSQIEESMRVYLYDFVMKMLIDTNNRGKNINGTATNAFDCWTTEIFPETKLMTMNSSKYNVDRQLTEAIDASSKDDLVLLCSSKTYTTLESNIRSQLFNSGKVNIYDYVGQVHVPNNKFSFNGNTIGIEQNNSVDVQYIPDNKVIIFDKKNYVRILTMLKVAGSQFYPTNLAMLKVLHLWLASGYLPWGKVMTYTNNNLNTSPSA